MINAKVIEVFRKSNNKIYGYRLQTTLGELKDVTPDKLKIALRTKKIVLSNYKLTTDNRIIQSENIFKPDKNNEYLLMNKNVVAAKYDMNFDILEEAEGKLPFAFDTFNNWLDSRKKFSCASDVKKFFESIGIKDTKDFIEVTHCVSLHDTFWVKKANSILKWETISPYRRSYSEVISTYALEGINLGNTEKNYFSPVVSTNGSFPHTWKYNRGNIKFIKAGSKYTLGGTNSGREPYSEYYASVIAEYLGFTHVAYDIRYHTRYDGRIDVVTECDCFTNEDIGTVTASNLKLEGYENVIAYCQNLSSNSYKTIIDMLFMDCLLLNTDRHFSNIEFLVDNNSLKVLDIAPIFDNNYSLIPRIIEGYDEFQRSDYTARDNRTFEELYKLVKSHKNYSKELIQLKKLKLLKPSKVQISEKRLAFLNIFLQTQVSYLLKLNN